ncbi:ABC transporter ATP-binding protein [Streptomycetaceae bacterium NBC_01309]
MWNRNRNRRRTAVAVPGVPTTAAGTDEALRLDRVGKTYGTEGNRVVALDDVSLTLRPGTFTAIMGPSGSGKSTLLQCAAGLDRPTSGRVFVDGTPIDGTDETALTTFRRDRIGFVFQQFNLMPTLTVLQNTTLPQRLAGRRPDEARAAAVLDRMGLGDRLGHLPSELSGGQQQRVAIARALVAEPKVVFGDEPTGALDSRSAREVLGLLAEAVRLHGQTVVMVTHDPVAASYAFLADGRIVGDLAAPTPDAVAERMTHLGDPVGGHRSVAAGF